MKKQAPQLVSFLIPTLNASKNLDECLSSIRRQNYPQNQIEIIIADGGSTDDTIQIAKKYNSIIVDNPLKTGEAGKAVALKHSKGTFICLVDSDNILPDKFWLNQMIKPLTTDSSLIGSEPWKFTYRIKAGFIERYSALIGANDPYAYYSGIYDRYSYLSHRWTGLKLATTDFDNYIKVKLLQNIILPTIGANGTLFKKTFLDQYLQNPEYLFDIDVISYAISQNSKPLYFSKTKNSIIHTFCENSISKFFRKQQRRIRDFYHYRNFRHTSWSTVNKNNAIKFSLYSLSLILPTLDSLKGYIHKHDIAWFFHPLACLLTTYVYISNFFMAKFGILTPQTRNQWQQ